MYRLPNFDKRLYDFYNWRSGKSAPMTVPMPFLTSYLKCPYRRSILKGQVA